MQRLIRFSPIVFRAISLQELRLLTRHFMMDGWMDGCVSAMDGCVSAALSRIPSSTKQYRGLVSKANMLSKFRG